MYSKQNANGECYPVIFLNGKQNIPTAKNGVKKRRRYKRIGNGAKKVRELRVKEGRKEKTSLLMIDSQSVKNTDTAKEQGYDGGKKIHGSASLC